jgi:hypothetical protein
MFSSPEQISDKRLPSFRICSGELNILTTLSIFFFKYT